MSKAKTDQGHVITQADYEALANLRYRLRRFMAFSASAAKAVGLPPQKHQALLAIKGNPGGLAMTVSRLAERLLIASHSATELVGRLIDAGSVTGTTDLDGAVAEVVGI